MISGTRRVFIRATLRREAASRTAYTMLPPAIATPYGIRVRVAEPRR